MPDEFSFNQAIKLLDNLTESLIAKYKLLRLYIVLELLFSLSLFLLLVLIYKRDLTDISYFDKIDSLIFRYTAVGITILFLNYLTQRILFRHLIPAFRKQYNEALKLCNSIVDKADWTSFRLRPETDNKRQSILAAVDRFYHLRALAFFPDIKKRINSVEHKAYLKIANQLQVSNNKTSLFYRCVLLIMLSQLAIILFMITTMIISIINILQF